METVFNRKSKLAVYRRYLLRRGFCVLPQKGKGEAMDPKALAGILHSFRTLGYALDGSVIKHLSKCPAEKVTEFYQYYFALMKDERGVAYPHPVFYPQFPDMEGITNIEYFVRACLHYLTARADTYGFVNDDLPTPKEVRSRDAGGECDKVEGISSRAVKKFFVDYAKKCFEGKLAISEEKYRLLEYIFQDYGDEIDITAIPFHENIGAYVDVLGGPKHLNEKMLSFVSVPTDVLRIYAVLSEESPSLNEHIKFKSLKRKDRRILLAKLNALAEKKPNFCEDLGRNEFLWKRALEKLHPGEFSQLFPALAKAVHDFRNDNYDTYYGLLEKAKEDQDRYLDLLSRRPGEFARRLDATLRYVGYDPQKTLKAFAEVGDKVSTPVLLSLWTFFANRPKGARRVFRFHVAFYYRVYAVERGLPPMLESTRKQIISLLEDLLRGIYAKRERVEKVYLSPSLKQYAVPANARNANSMNKTLTYGSRISLPKKVRYLRCFTHWHNMKGDPKYPYQGRVDIDLSAEFLTEDFRHNKSLGWHNMAAMNAYHCFHSGDFVTAPRGASEFIDLDVEVVEPAYRYIAIVNTIYSGHDFASTPECFSGVAFLSAAAYKKPRTRHERLKPSTVKYKFDLTTKDCGEIVAFIVDTKTRELIWVDAPFTAGKGHVAACDLRVVAQIQDAIKTRMNLYDFFLLHSGHVSFVDDPKEADLFIGDEDEANLKPYFVQDIIADWL